MSHKISKSNLDKFDICPSQLRWYMEKIKIVVPKTMTLGIQIHTEVEAILLDKKGDYLPLSIALANTAKEVLHPTNRYLERRMYFSYKDIDFSAMPDAYSIKGDEAILIDHKTAGSRTAYKKHMVDFFAKNGPALYALAIFEEHPEVNVLTASWHYGRKDLKKPKVDIAACTISRHEFYDQIAPKIVEKSRKVLDIIEKGAWTRNLRACRMFGPKYICVYATHCHSLYEPKLFDIKPKKEVVSKKEYKTMKTLYINCMPLNEKVVTLETFLEPLVTQFEEGHYKLVTFGRGVGLLEQALREAVEQDPSQLPDALYVDRMSHLGKDTLDYLRGVYQRVGKVVLGGV